MPSLPIASEPLPAAQQSMGADHTPGPSFLHSGLQLEDVSFATEEIIFLHRAVKHKRNISEIILSQISFILGTPPGWLLMLLCTP